MGVLLNILWLIVATITSSPPLTIKPPPPNKEQGTTTRLLPKLLSGVARSPCILNTKHFHSSCLSQYRHTIKPPPPPPNKEQKTTTGLLPMRRCLVLQEALTSTTLSTSIVKSLQAPTTSTLFDSITEKRSHQSIFQGKLSP